MPAVGIRSRSPGTRRRPWKRRGRGCGSALALRWGSNSDNVAIDDVSFTMTLVPSPELRAGAGRSRSAQAERHGRRGRADASWRRTRSRAPTSPAPPRRAVPNSRPGAAAISAAARTWCSMRATRRSVTAGRSWTAPSSAMGVREEDAASARCSASRWRSRRPWCTGASSSSRSRSAALRPHVARDLRSSLNSSDLAEVTERLAKLVERYRRPTPKLAE
jgi:hypothetical protein